MPTTFNYGTSQIYDTLAANRTLIAEYGEDNAYQAVSMLLEAHNKLTAMMLTDLADFTSDRLRRYGGTAQMDMIEGDEYSSADAQKLSQGVNIGFSLKKFQLTLQFTRSYMQTKTVAELAAQMDGAFTADIVRMQKELKTAIFNSVNNLTYTDRLVDYLQIPLRSLLNADSTAIPVDPYGNTFNIATHTHYIATAAFVLADFNALVTLVQEHHNTGTVLVYINQAQEAAVRALAGFTGYVDSRIIPSINNAVASGALNTMEIYNRSIGVLGAAEIWIKPWIPTNYMFAFNPKIPKPLIIRTRTGLNAPLALAAEYDAYPLRAQFMEREYGINVFNRENGAVLYTGGGAYVVPTF